MSLLRIRVEGPVRVVSLVEADEALSLGIVSQVSPTRDAAVADAVALDVEAEVQSRLLMSPQPRAGFAAIRKSHT